MENIFGDLNVLEILKFGLSGLLLLLTFLAYRLIDREQLRQGPARQEILRIIYKIEVFQCFAFFGFADRLHFISTAYSV
jgi:bacteriorhodopsin